LLGRPSKPPLIMTYFESAEGQEITPARAKKEIEAHGCSWHEFLLDNGMQETYLAQDVLLWLGY
jgi:hypothetical protein